MKKIKPSEIQKYLDILEQTPRHIAHCSRNVAKNRLYASSETNEWSIVEVLAHLRACDDVWVHTIFAMLLADRPNLPRFHPRDWEKLTRYDQLDFYESLRVFTLKRAECLTVLKKLSSEQWSRNGIIDGRNHSVFSQVRRLALHEAGHYDQIEQILLY
jgi:hypothetical protein